jgi:hypothetical protein
MRKNVFSIQELPEKQILLNGRALENILYTVICSFTYNIGYSSRGCEITIQR